MAKRLPILLGIFLVILAIWLQVTSVQSLRQWVMRLEYLAYDVQLRTTLLTHHQPLQSSVAIIDIDDRSLAAVGRWPWPRVKMANLITQLQKYGAVVIVLDMIFPEKELNTVDEVLRAANEHHMDLNAISPTLAKLRPLFDYDADLAASLSKDDSVLGVTFLPTAEEISQLPAPIYNLQTVQTKQLGFIQAQGIIGNIPILQNAAKHAGFINVFPDEDGVIRRVPIVLRYKNSIYPSLALEAVRLYLLSQIELLTADYGGTLRLEGVKVGNYHVPTDSKGQVIIPFKGPSYTFPYYSALDVLTNKLPPQIFIGKLIFIGTSATNAGDLKATAIQSTFPGIEIQATIADGILKNNFSYKPAWSVGAEIVLTLVLGGILLFVFPYLGPRTLSIITLIIPTVLIFLNSWLWEKTGLIISIFAPILLVVSLALTNIICGYLFETRRRERLKEMFGQYVPPTHIDEMLKSSGNYGLYGEDREMTVLFADIRNFTAISEKMSAAELKEMLNQFLTPMTATIFNNHGTIDKYVGDLIMAFWGAPLKDKRHAQHAMQAAIDMQKNLTAINQNFNEKGWAMIQIGIGLNSGLMTVGDMGSTFRRNYTVLGDAVNLASRVEGLTKYYGAKIIVTAETFKNHKNLFFRLLDKVKVKGKQNGIAIYELLGRQSEASAEFLIEIKDYHLALDFYFQREWAQAQRLFGLLTLQYPNSRLYSLYLQRCDEFLSSPPAPDWDGVYTHLTK
jgi:adenylate cyclase